MAVGVLACASNATAASKNQTILQACRTSSSDAMLCEQSKSGYYCSEVIMSTFPDASRGARADLPRRFPPPATARGPPRSAASRAATSRD